MDHRTLEQVDAWLAELGAELEKRPAHGWRPDLSPQETAHAVGQWEGLNLARAFLKDMARKHRPAGIGVPGEKPR